MPERCCAYSANPITVVAVGVDPDDGDLVEVVELLCENRVGRRWPTGERRDHPTRQQRAASMIMSVTMSGCVIATWEESTSRVSAFLRWAVKRLASGSEKSPQQIAG